MLWLDCENDRFWIAEHTKLGLIIFDPKRSLHKLEEKQSHLKPDQKVRLFRVADNHWSIFDREVVKTKLLDRMEFETKHPSSHEAFIEAYKASLLIPWYKTSPPPPPPKYTDGEGGYSMFDYYGGVSCRTGTRAYDPSTGGFDIPI